jgi:excinuclease ABC subunit A
MKQVDRLVAAGNSVIIIEHDMNVVSQSDWVIDIGPGAGEDGGRVVAVGTPAEIAHASASKTSAYLRSFERRFASR